MTFSTIQERVKTFAMALNTVWNIIYGLFSCLRLALQLFWEEYGEEIQVGMVKSVLLTIDFAGEVFLLGRKSRRYFDVWLTRQLDSAFFQLVDIQ